MSTTLSLDATGGLFVPAALLERAHLLGGNVVTVDVENDRLVVKSAGNDNCLEEDSVAEDNPNVRLVRKGKIQVFTGFDGPFDAVAAVEQARKDREEELVAHRSAE